MKKIQNKILTLIKSILIISLLYFTLNTANAAVIAKSGTIRANETWTTGNTYQITSTLTLNSGITLTIQPGVVVKLNPSVRLNIYGNLQAVASSGNEIHFTSRDDNTVGEVVTGSDGVPNAGNWDKIYLNDSGSDASVFDHVVVKYASYGFYLSRSGADILNSTISNTSYKGIYIRYYSNPIIENNTIINNTGEGFYCNNDIYYSVLFRGNTISGNGKSSQFCTLDPLLEGNPTNTTYTDVGTEYRVALFNINSTTNGVLPKQSLPIVVYGGTFDAGKILTIAPGNIFRINNSVSVNINGNIQAIGTEAEPIIFTSLNDNSAGGSVIGSTGTPNPGNWNLFEIGRYQSSSANNTVFDKCIFRYGTNQIRFFYTNAKVLNSTFTLFSGNIDFTRSYSTFNGNTVSNSSNTNRAIYVDSGYSPTITNNIITNNAGKGISCETTSVTNFTGNSFSNNGKVSRLCTLDPLLEGVIGYNETWTYYEVSSIHITPTTGVLPKLGKPIVLYGGTLLAGKTLTIAPGNIFRMQSGGYTVNIQGTLNAVGTVAEPIVFTSINDDTAGGNIPLLSNSTPNPGNWNLFEIGRYQSSSANNTVFDKCIFRYGTNQIRFYYTNAKVLNSTFTLFSGNIDFTRSYSIFNGNTVSNSSNTNRAIYVEGYSPTISNNTIVKNSGVGIYLGSTTAVVKNNISYGNTYGIQCSSLNAGTYITYNLFNSNTTALQNGTNCTIGATNKIVDPLFVDYANNDFNLKTGSPAIDIGNPAILHPISGTAYDIGAFEYIPGLINTLKANIQNPDGKILTYEWKFTKEPSNGTNKPNILSGGTGTIVGTGTNISTSFMLKYLGDHTLNLSISDAGTVIKQDNYNFTTTH